MENSNPALPESDPSPPSPSAPSSAPPAPPAAPDGSQPIAAPAPAPPTVTQENAPTATAPAAAPPVTQPPAPPADAAPAPTQQQPVDDLFADDDDDDDVAPSASPGKLFDDDDDEDMPDAADEEEEEEEYEDEGDAEDDEEDEEDSQAEDDEALARRLQREWEEEDNRPRRNRRARRYDSSESPSPPRKRRAPPKKERSSRRAAAQKSYVEVGSSAEDESDIDVGSDGSPRARGDTYGTKKGRRSPPPTDSKEGIERLLCQETLTKKEWRPILEKMRTKHVFHGSAMDVPDGGEALPEDEDLPITRYLVKWKQFSFLHVSWETKTDLESIDQKACQRAIMSLQGRERKGQVPEIGKPPCAKRAFDPQMVEVERVLELPGLVGGEAGEKRLALNLPPPDLEEDGIMEGEENNYEEQAAASGVDLDDAAARRKFAAEQYESALKETEAQGEARRKAVADAVALCAATVAPPDAEDVLVKWTGLGYDEASRERWSDVLEACADREDLDARVVACARRFASKPTRSQASARAAQDKASVKAVKRAVPLAPYRGGPLHLRPYQIDGVAWLAFNYLQKRSSILADEMGLGKTVQTVSLVRMAKERYGAQGPALIVAPLSTLAHWQREFEHWSALDVMVYHGSQASRLEARNLDLMARKTAAKKNPKVKTPKTPSVDVVVTTYEQLLLEDSANALGQISWSLLVVDEAHRLKNPHSRLYRTLHGDNGTFKAISRLLLTGTPLQNNMTELWSLLSFCDEKQFGEDSEEFVEKYASCAHEAPAEGLAVQEKDDDAEDDGSVLSSLLDEMRPYVLRRVKAHVEKSVPPKEEIVVSVALAPLQKRYYRALYEKNVLMLAGTGRPVDGPSLMNLAMELRKCCNHPFLLKGVERQEEARLTGQTERERLVGACGKLQFLDKLLPRLFQESNRKVLIFSQFVMMLDVLSDYLRSAKYAHGRVDGGVTGRDRQKQIDQFAQQGEGAVRVMLLSTRAGGVGINLVAADTVVVYDSDWNPQNDVQAMARCHRIGQTRKVTVYRLLTAGTYEAHMYAVATAKLSLDRAVLDGMASANAGNRHLHESLLKQGAGAVSFKPHAVNKELDDDEDDDAKAFRDQSLDDILATRSKAVVLASDTSGGALESLSSATFVASKEEDKIALDDPDFWEKTLGKDALKQKKEIVDTTQRKAKQGDKEYVHNYGPVDRVKKRQRDADYYEDVPEDKKEQHPYDWGKTQARELRLVLPKRPIGMEPSRFVRGYCSLERRPEPKDAISAAHDALASYGRAMARERHHIAQERGDDTSSWRRMKSGGHIDQDWVSKLITRNRALKSSLTAIVKREAPDRSIDLETLIAAFYGATNTPGYLGANVCAQNDDRDGSNRCKKILEAANDLEVSRVLLDKALKALGENPSTDQIRSALGMENIAVSSRPAPWWDARHDLCLLKGVLEHGPLASEKVREAILEDQALDWPADMPQAPPKPPAWLSPSTEAPAPAPASNGDANGKKKPAAKKPEKKLPHLPDRTKLNARHLALVRAATGASDEEPVKKRKAPRPKKEKGPPDQAPKRQKASASKPTGKPVEVIDVDAPSIPKKKTSVPKKQATMTSFFGSKKKEENGSKFPGWGKKREEEDDPTLDDLRAKARAAQENTANDEAIARSLEED